MKIVISYTESFVPEMPSKVEEEVSVGEESG